LPPYVRRSLICIVFPNKEALNISIYENKPKIY
jgi:hypothetical protein